MGKEKQQRTQRQGQTSSFFPDRFPFLPTYTLPLPLPLVPLHPTPHPASWPFHQRRFVKLGRVFRHELWSGSLPGARHPGILAWEQCQASVDCALACWHYSWNLNTLDCEIKGIPMIWPAWSLRIIMLPGPLKKDRWNRLQAVRHCVILLYSYRAQTVLDIKKLALEKVATLVLWCSTQYKSRKFSFS